MTHGIRILQFYGPNRLAGHSLRSEGKPFEVTPGGAIVRRTGYRSYWGLGLCSCGATSTQLKSNEQRKQWHRDHKAAVRAEQEAGA